MPFLVPSYSMSVSFSVEVNSPCSTTLITSKLDLQESLTYVGEESYVWRFTDWPDTISTAIQKSISQDLPFCEDRHYKISNIESPLGVSLIDPPVVELNDEYMFFRLNAPTAAYLGVHKVTVEVVLANFING